MFEILKIGLYNKYFPDSTLYLALSYVAVFVIGYLLGSLNFGVIISKAFYRDDVRNHGSGNAGAANMLRTHGKIVAALTFLGDGLKAAVSVLIGALILGHNPIFAGSYFGGMASIIGHAFPLYYGFKGGKSVAAALFMVLCTNPIVALICLVFFIIIVAGTKFVSLGSIMAIIVYPLLLNRFSGLGLHNLIAIFIMLLIVFLHRKNIKRLLNGEENKLSFGKKDKTKNDESEKSSTK